MVADKIRAIKHIITAQSYSLYFKRGGNHYSCASGSGDLSDLIAVAIQLKRDSGEMMKAIEVAATESGELQLLIKLREAMDKIDGGH